MIHRWRMRRALLAIHEGELPRKRSALAAHLNQCPACADTVRRLAESDRLLVIARPEPEALAPETAGLLLQRALAAAVASRRPSPWLSLAPVGLAVAVFLVAAVGPSWIPLRNAGQSLKPVEIAQGLSASARAHAGVGRELRAEEASPSAEARQSRITPPRGTASVATRRSLRRSRHEAAVRSAVIGRQERALHLLRSSVGSRQQPFPLASDSRVEAPAGSEDLAGVMEPEGEASPPAQMLVMLTAGHVDELVTVRNAPVEMPGYARVAALQPDVNGDLVWTQATVSSEESGPALVLQTLGDGFRYW
jgi:hypothetical protein